MRQSIVLSAAQIDSFWRSPTWILDCGRDADDPLRLAENAVEAAFLACDAASYVKDAAWTVECSATLG